MKKKKQIKTVSFPEAKFLPEANTANLFGNIRNFFIKLLAGKKSIMINCKLLNSDAIVNGNCFLLKNDFIYGKNVENRVEGITIKFPSLPNDKVEVDNK